MQETYGEYNIILLCWCCIVNIAFQDFAHRNCDTVTLNDDFALRDGPIVGEHGNRFVLSGVELDDGAAAHAQELVHGYDRASEHDGDFDFNGVDRRRRRHRESHKRRQGRSWPIMLTSPLMRDAIEPAEWVVSPHPVAYPDAVARM